MNAAETNKLCRVIAGLAPAQKFDDETPAFWCTVLADVAYADASEAVKRLARRIPFIGTADICAEVAALRKARVQAADAADELVPNVDPDDAHAFIAERRAIMQAAADGVLDIETYAAGGFTLTGVEPRRPRAEMTADPERADAIIRAGVAALARPPAVSVRSER